MSIHIYIYKKIYVYIYIYINVHTNIYIYIYMCIYCCAHPRTKISVSTRWHEHDHRSWINRRREETAPTMQSNWESEHTMLGVHIFHTRTEAHVTIAPTPTAPWGVESARCQPPTCINNAVCRRMPVPHQNSYSSTATMVHMSPTDASPGQQCVGC